MDETAYNALFGARVKYYRERKGLTQQELADRLGYTSHASIAKIEKGKSSILLSKLPDFCVALDVDAFDLLGLTERDKMMWSLAEKAKSDGSDSDLRKFVDIYLKLLEGK